METTNQRIYRSNDRVISGVIGGFAERFDLEPTLLRLSVVFLTVVTGVVPGVITYLVAIALMPGRPTSKRREEPVSTVDESAQVEHA